jgi:hypothetical protein
MTKPLCNKEKVVRGEKGRTADAIKINAPRAYYQQNQKPEPSTWQGALPEFPLAQNLSQPPRPVQGYKGRDVLKGNGIYIKFQENISVELQHTLVDMMIL